MLSCVGIKIGTAITQLRVGMKQSSKRDWIIFLWKAMGGALPAKTSLKRRGLEIEEHCDHCMRSEGNADAETIGHILRDCSLAKHVWRGCRIGIRVDKNFQLPIEVCIKQWLSYLNKQPSHDFNGLMYFILIPKELWNSRNKEVFEAKHRDPDKKQAYLRVAPDSIERARRLGILHARLHLPNRALIRYIKGTIEARREDKTILEKLWKIFPYFHCVEAALNNQNTS
ncbi:Peptidase T [Bienertia sinuspersici]